MFIVWPHSVLNDNITQKMGINALPTCYSVITMFSFSENLGS